MNKSFSKDVAKTLEEVFDGYKIGISANIKVKKEQILIRLVEDDFVDYLLLPMSSEQGYIVIRYDLNRKLGEWDETDRWHVVSDGSAEDMGLEIAREVFGLSGYYIPDLDWELNPRRKNSVSSSLGSIALAGLAGFLLSKK